MPPTHCDRDPVSARWLAASEATYPVELITTVRDVRATLSQHRAAGESIGLVPTMGAFHEGHLALMRRSRERDNVVVVSLFVNPTQFGPGEDYEQYPRDLDRDSCMAADAGVDLLFTPSVAEMYPPGDSTFVEVTGDLTARLCGAYRPGHFRGVTTVVAKLFNITQPDRAYFGEKDYQQLLAIRRMVRDLGFPLEIVPVPTVREPDGVAMSSRNVRLGPKERQAATALYRSLRKAQELAAAGTLDSEGILSAVREAIAQEPLVKLQYAEIGDPETLAPVERIDGPALLAVAAYVGGVRLIDNTILEARPESTLFGC
jgi:pantoate--beta-alanine ligase